MAGIYRLIKDCSERANGDVRIVALKCFGVGFAICAVVMVKIMGEKRFIHWTFMTVARYQLKRMDRKGGRFAQKG